jgi:hypothetical protein
VGDAVTVATWDVPKVITDGAIKTYDLSGLAADKMYLFEIKAVKDAAESVWVGVYAKTKTAEVVVTPPEVPDDLHSTDKTDNAVTLAWDTVANATDYEVQYRKFSDTEWTSVSASGTETTISGLSTNTEYEFKVRAVNDAGESDWSATVSITTDKTKHVIDFEFLADFLGSDKAFPNNLAANGASAYIYPDWLTFEDAPQYGDEVKQYFVVGIGFTYNMSYDEDWDYYSWYGFGLSTSMDTTYAGYMNEMSSVTGFGYDHSSVYGIAYWADWNEMSLVMQLPEGALIDSMMITNTVYSWGSMELGDDFTSPLGEDEYHTLVVVGLDADGTLGEVRFDMGIDGVVVSEWVKLDLSSLAGASQLQFSFDSNVTSYDFLDYPTYFAFDDIVYYA